MQIPMVLPTKQLHILLLPRNLHFPWFVLSTKQGLNILFPHINFNLTSLTHQIIQFFLPQRKIKSKKKTPLLGFRWWRSIFTLTKLWIRSKESWDLDYYETWSLCCPNFGSNFLLYDSFAEITIFHKTTSFILFA